MRFDRRTRPNPYLNRSDQYRLLRLVALIAMVLVLVQVAGRPSSWNWFFALSQPQSTPEGEETADDFGGPLTPIAVKRPGSTAPLPEGAFYGRVGDDTPGDAASPDGTPSTMAELRLPAETFAGVEDDWLGATRAEQPALVRVARHLDETDQALLQREASREATFDSLVGRPEYFRGRPVRIAGRLRRFTSSRIGVGDDVREVWEAWVVADDSRNTPYFVYCLSAPEQMPTGESIDEAVRFSGYVIRRYAYASRGGETVTTMLMAPTLGWTPPGLPAAEQLTHEMQWSTIIGAVFLATVLLSVGIWYFVSDRRFRRSRLHAIGESRLDADPDDLQALSQIDGGDPHQIRIDESAEVSAVKQPS